MAEQRPLTNKLDETQPMPKKVKDSLRESERAAKAADAVSQGDVGGEGNYSATHRYNEGLEASVKKGNSDELAEKAKQALDSPEGEQLRQADKKGKAARTPS